MPMARARRVRWHSRGKVRWRRGSQDCIGKSCRGSGHLCVVVAMQGNRFFGRIGRTKFAGGLGEGDFLGLDIGTKPVKGVTVSVADKGDSAARPG